MKFTSEDLMKAMGLQVGDRVKYCDKVYIVSIEDNKVFLKDGVIWLYLLDIVDDQDYEILPRPKRVGDLKCGEYGEHNCASCPIRAICAEDEYNDKTLYSILELSHKFAKDQEIYNLLKSRLDKEVKE